MDPRTPIFVYDRISGETDLIFITNATLERSHITINDRKSSHGDIAINIVPTSIECPHRMIIHYDGEDFQMLAIDDTMIQSIKAYMFTREVINKHIDKVTYRRRTCAPILRKSMLSRCVC